MEECIAQSSGRSASRRRPPATLTITDGATIAYCEKRDKTKRAAANLLEKVSGRD